MPAFGSKADYIHSCSAFRLLTPKWTNGFPGSSEVGK